MVINVIGAGLAIYPKVYVKDCLRVRTNAYVDDVEDWRFKAD